MSYATLLCHCVCSLVSIAPTAPPSNIQVTVLGPYSVHLTWEMPPAQYRNGIIRRYEINITRVGIGQETLQSSTTNITIPNLRASTMYRFSVAAYTVELGPFSQPDIEVETDVDGKIYLS